LIVSGYVVERLLRKSEAGAQSTLLRGNQCGSMRVLLLDFDTSIVQVLTPAGAKHAAK
jgi:hypothetical protein